MLEVIDLGFGNVLQVSVFVFGTVNALSHVMLLDYAEDPPTEETFAIRFKNSEIAGEFKQRFEESAKINALIHENKSDELADALSKLTVSAGAGDADEEAEGAAGSEAEAKGADATANDNNATADGGAAEEEKKAAE